MTGKKTDLLQHIFTHASISPGNFAATPRSLGGSGSFGRKGKRDFQYGSPPGTTRNRKMERFWYAKEMDCPPFFDYTVNRKERDERWQKRKNERF